MDKLKCKDRFLLLFFSGPEFICCPGLIIYNCLGTKQQFRWACPDPGDWESVHEELREDWWRQDGVQRPDHLQAAVVRQQAGVRRHGRQDQVPHHDGQHQGLDARHVLQEREAGQVPQHHPAKPLCQNLPEWRRPLQYTGEYHVLWMIWMRCLKTSLFIIHVTILSFNFNAFAQSSLKRTDQKSCMCRLSGRLTVLNAKHSLNTNKLYFFQLWNLTSLTHLTF